MNCCLCQQEELAFNFFTGKRQVVKPPEGTKKMICSRCVQILLAASEERLRKAYQMALEKDFLDKAEAIKFFFKGRRDEYVPEANHPRSCLARRRTMRRVSSSNIRDYRTQQSALRMDSRRAKSR